MQSSKGVDLFRSFNHTSTDCVIAALENAYLRTVSHGIMSHDIPTMLLELSYEHKFFTDIREITQSPYRAACDVLTNGGAVICPGLQLRRQLRDSSGFSEPTAIDRHSNVYIRGFTDNPYRPAVLVQSMTGMPKGHNVIGIKNRGSIVLPTGSYFIDEAVFEEIMAGQSLWCVEN